VNLVVDASVIIKWFAVEELMDEADRLRPLLADLAAPDFCLVELANIAWKKLLRGTFLLHEALEIIPHLRRSRMQFLPSEPLLNDALTLAHEFDHPVYDCLYVAATDLLGAKFLTWDKPLHAKLAQSRFASSTYLLSDIDRLLADLAP
jgi:predicted nucleic acid-binding protein